MKVKINKTCVRQIKQVARKNIAVENCGLLLGTTSEELVTILDLVRVRNRSPLAVVAFEIHPHDMIKAVQKADKNDLQIVGVWHTHPIPAKPSAIDLQQMFSGENRYSGIWIIYSARYDDFGTFIIENGQVLEIKPEII